MKKTIIYLIASLFVLASCSDSGVKQGNLLQEVNLIPVMKQGGATTYSYINTGGEEVFMSPFVEGAGLFFDGLAKGKINSMETKGGGWRYINTKGEIVIDASAYQTVTDFSEGIAWCETWGRKWIAINTKGEELFTLDGRPMGLFSEGLAACKSSSDKDVFVDKRGKVVLEPEKYIWQATPQFINGRCCVYYDLKFGAIDKSGKKVIDLISEEPFFFDCNGNAVLKVKGEASLVDYNGETLIPAGRFKEITNDGKWYRVSSDGQHYGWCDEKGEMKIDCNAVGRWYSYGNLFMNNDFAYVSIDNKPCFVDRQGEATPVSSLALEIPFVNGFSFVRAWFGIVLIKTSMQKVNDDVYNHLEFNSVMAADLFHNIHTEYALIK